jgi:hypothetical protein
VDGVARVTKADKKVVADEAAARLRQYGPTAILPVPGNPPPPLRQGEGEIELRQKPTSDGVHDVPLDAAAFITLWRYCEAHALQLHNNPSPHARPSEEVYLRAVKAFRAASGQDLALVPAKKAWGAKNAAPLRNVVKRDAARALKKAWGKP